MMSRLIKLTKSDSHESNHTLFEFFFFYFCLLRFPQQMEMLNWPLRSAQLSRDGCVCQVQLFHAHQKKHLAPAGHQLTHFKA